MHKLWIADGHCDSLGDLTSGKRDLLGLAGEGHWDLVKACQAGIGLQFFAAYIESEYKPFLAGLRGLEHIEAALRFIDNNPEDVFLVKGQDDLSNLGNSKKIGLVLHIEGGEILGESLFMLDIIYRLGVRSIGLTWNERNALADGVGEVGSQGGLSRFGKQVMKRMNSLGMVIDVSHLNEAGFWDVVAGSVAPIIASHSCARALCDHPRNLSDKQLKALAEVKGLVGVNFCQDFLNETGKATIDDVVRHICYIAEVAGVDCVAFGSDYDGIPSPPLGLEDASKFPHLLEKLKDCGFKDTELTKICHGNFVRVLANVLK
ncbi:MAG TPA: membrane dipeptidase [Peptococcaceae bacterium]|nr:membrane dipeptidase [Peptococcaceae bacterium]